MAEHNLSLPRHLYGFVRERFLYDGEPGHEAMIPAVIHGISSTPSRSLGFHVLLENGARWSDLPLHALAHSRYAADLPLEELSLWDAFGHEVTATAYEYLRDLEVKARLRSGRVEAGVYVCSFDWINSGFSLEPVQHKEIHLIALDNGNYALLPNYRLLFSDPSFTVPATPPKYIPQSKAWHSEWGFHLDGENAVVEEA